MALGPSDLVICSGTFARHVPLRDRVEAAAAGGFQGLSLWARDYWQARHSGLTDRDLRSVLADHDVRVAELDGVWAWLPAPSVPLEHDAEAFFRYGEDDLYRIADAVGARSINAVDVFGGDWTIADAAEAFAGLCDRADAHGLLVHLEFLPWSRIPDVATAWEIVRSADRPNGGIAVDSWHFFRGNTDWDGLQAVPGDRILGVQLSDGPAEPEPDLVAATLRERRVPGEGDFDLSGLLRVLGRLGVGAPLGVEIFSDELHALPPVEAARRAGEATRALMTRA